MDRADCVHLCLTSITMIVRCFTISNNFSTQSSLVWCSCSAFAPSYVCRSTHACNMLFRALSMYFLKWSIESEIIIIAKWNISFGNIVYWQKKFVYRITDRPHSILLYHLQYDTFKWFCLAILLCLFRLFLNWTWSVCIWSEHDLCNVKRFLQKYAEYVWVEVQLEFTV